MSKKNLLIIVMALNSWLPWTHEFKTILVHERPFVVFTGEPSYLRGQCCGADRRSFLIHSNCGNQDLPMVTLHETQHLLLFLYPAQFADGRYDYFQDSQEWKRFVQLATACAAHTKPQKMRLIEKFTTLGPTELHAQLPWLLSGNLCPELQPWYPWFDLTKAQALWVRPSQEDAPRSILKR